MGPVDELFPHSQKESSHSESQTSVGVFTATEVLRRSSRVLGRYIVYGVITHVCVCPNVHVEMFSHKMLCLTCLLVMALHFHCYIL